MNKDSKFGLAIQGGAMRTMYSAGAVRFLIDSGISQQVKVVAGSSAGVISGLALLAAGGDAREYAETLDEIFAKVASKQFINAKRLKCVVDVDFLVKTTFDTIDLVKLRRSLETTELHVSMMNLDAHTEYVIFNDTNREISQIRGAAIATMAIPGLYGRKAIFNGKRYFDGGIGDPLPLIRAIGVSDVTDVVGIATVPAGEIGKSISKSQALALRTMRNIPDQVRRAASARSSLGDATDQILAQGDFAGVNVWGIMPDKSLGALTNIDHGHLRKIEQQGYDEARKSLKI